MRPFRPVIELILLQRNAGDLTRGWGPYLWLPLCEGESILAMTKGDEPEEDMTKYTVSRIDIPKHLP